MKIVNEYRIRPGITIDDIAAEIKKKHLPWNGASTYIHKDAIHSTFKELVEDISVNIAFPEDLSTWDSYNHILIMDEICGQPYYPFYDAAEDEHKRFPFVMNVIGSTKGGQNAIQNRVKAVANKPNANWYKH